MYTYIRGVRASMRKSHEMASKMPDKDVLFNGPFKLALKL